MDTIKPDTDYLNTIYIDAKGDKPDDVFLQNYLKSMKALLKDDPRKYRTYGPFWPSVKALMLSNGADFLPDDEIQFDVKATYDYEAPIHTLLAATLYAGERVDNGLVYESHHLLVVSPDAIDSDDGYDYVSYDRGMEDRITQLGL